MGILSISLPDSLRAEWVVCAIRIASLYDIMTYSAAQTFVAVASVLYSCPCAEPPISRSHRTQLGTKSTVCYHVLLACFLVWFACLFVCLVCLLCICCPTVFLLSARVDAAYMFLIKLSFGNYLHFSTARHTHTHTHILLFTYTVETVAYFARSLPICWHPSFLFLSSLPSDVTVRVCAGEKCGRCWMVF